MVAGRHGDDLGCVDMTAGADHGGGCDPRRAEDTDADGRHRCRLQRWRERRWCHHSGRCTSACHSPVRRTTLRIVPASRSHDENLAVVGSRRRVDHEAPTGVVLDERPAVGQGQSGGGQAAAHPCSRGVLDADRVGLGDLAHQLAGDPGAHRDVVDRSGQQQRRQPRARRWLVFGTDLGMEVDPAVVGGARAGPWRRPPTSRLRPGTRRGASVVVPCRPRPSKARSARAAQRGPVEAVDGGEVLHGEARRACSAGARAVPAPPMPPPPCGRGCRRRREPRSRAAPPSSS